MNNSKANLVAFCRSLSVYLSGGLETEIGVGAKVEVQVKARVEAGARVGVRVKVRAEARVGARVGAGVEMEAQNMANIETEVLLLLVKTLPVLQRVQGLAFWLVG